MLLIHNWNCTIKVLTAEVVTCQLANDVAADMRIGLVRPTQRTALGILDAASLFRYCQSFGSISSMQVFGPTRRCFFLHRLFLCGRPDMTSNASVFIRNFCVPYTMKIDIVAVTVEASRDVGMTPVHILCMERLMDVA